MASYIFSCSECEHADTVRINMDSRNDTLTCPECGKESFSYNFMLTMKGSQVAVHEDLVSFMDRKMSKNKLYQGAPTWNRSVAGKTSARPGAGRHFMGDPKYNKKWV